MFKFVLFSLIILLTNLTMAGPNGKSIYTEHCSACHQTQGKGGIGLPLTPEILSGLSDEYIIKTIYYGRMGRIMPAFPTLSDAQTKAIVKYLRINSNTKSAVFSQKRVNGNLAKGKALYNTNCLKCHAVDGQGQGSGTGVTLSRKRSFLVMPAAISNSGFLASASDEMIKHIIVNGRKKNGMPAFNKKGLSDQDVNNIISYIRSIDIEKENTESIDPNERPTYVIKSSYGFEKTVKNIKRAISNANFRVFPERYLEQGLFDEFSVNKRQLGIRFCNFNKLYSMLKIEPRLGTVLPCRITIMERENKEVIMVIPNLKVVARLFNNDELVDLWMDMEENLNDLIDEASL